MSAFFAGVLFGLIFMGSIVAAYLTRRHRPQQPAIWTEEHYRQAPPVVTRITINRKREIEL